jgi:hypothetical protein
MGSRARTGWPRTGCSPGRSAPRGRTPQPPSVARAGGVQDDAPITPSLYNPSIYKIGFANLAGSGACSTVSSFCTAMTPPMGSLTMSETTTLETL